MKNKKHVFALYQIFENDSLRDYLEDMAERGWKLVKVTNMLLHFEACEPHPIRYCVEIMDKPSVYASNQTLPLRKYREFCRDAGWDYIGTTGLLHIFYTEDRNAIPVETDSEERYERICRASAGGSRATLILFSLISLLNLFLCFQKRTLLCPQGFIVLILMGTAAFYVGDFYLWKRRALRSLAASKTLPHAGWQTVRFKNNFSVALILLVCILYLLYTSFDALTDAPLIMLLPLLIYLIVYVLMFYFFSRLIYWLREKNTFSRTTNILIYWGSGLALVIALVSVTAFILMHFL